MRTEPNGDISAVMAKDFRNNWMPMLFFGGIMILLGGCATLPGTLYDLNSHSTIPISELSRHLGDNRVVFVGEAHDNEIDHIVQMEVIRQLQEKGKAVAIGLEMFPAARQPALDEWISGRLDEALFIKAYYEAWSVPYAYYENIFLYAREHGIRLVGLNITKERFDELSRHGIGAELPRTLIALRFRSCGQETAYANAMRGYLTRLGHTGNFNRMCDTQRFREAFMAKRIADFLDGSRETLVVLVGAAHARKMAVPEMLRRHGKRDYMVLLPDNFSALMNTMLTKGEGDLVWQ